MKNRSVEAARKFEVSPHIIAFIGNDGIDGGVRDQQDKLLLRKLTISQ